MLVSAIMPTADRPGFVPLALECFRWQTWPEKELIVLDSGADPVERLCADIPGVRYYRLPRAPVPAARPTLGGIRNLAVQVARGSVVIHWDDDDWSAAVRMESQVRRLMRSGKAVTGYHRMLYWDVDGQAAYQYRYTGAAPYACGTSQCYWREWAMDHPFPDKDYGEDTDFSHEAARRGELDSTDAGKLMVVRSHAGCTGKHPLGNGRSFPPVDRSEIPQEFFAAIGQDAQSVTLEASSVRPERESQAGA